MMNNQIKQHFREFGDIYTGIAIGMCVAGSTYLIMRGSSSQPISPAIGVTASPAIGVTGKKVVIGTISYISANRSGPPSWVVRCIETNQIYTSQNAAAVNMGLSAQHISRHLNGLRTHVGGYTFERICLAA